MITAQVGDQPILTYALLSPAATILAEKKVSDNKHMIGTWRNLACTYVEYVKCLTTSLMMNLMDPPPARAAAVAAAFLLFVVVA